MGSSSSNRTDLALALVVDFLKTSAKELDFAMDMEVMSNDTDAIDVMTKIMEDSIAFG